MNAINAKINFVHVFLMKKIKFFAKKKKYFLLAQNYYFFSTQTYSNFLFFFSEKITEYFCVIIFIIANFLFFKFFCLVYSRTSFLIL